MRFVGFVALAMCASCNDRTKPASSTETPSAAVTYAPVTTVTRSGASPTVTPTASTGPTPPLVDLLPPEGTMGAKCTHIVSDAAHVEETLERDGRVVAVAAIVRAPGDTRFEGARDHLNGHGLLESGDTTELYARPFIVRVSKNADAKVRRAVLARFDLNGLMVEATQP